MDRNIVNNAICFPSDFSWQCDITCSAVSHCGGFFATGTRQGSVVLWKIRKRKRVPTANEGSVPRLRYHLECFKGLQFEPYYMLLASNTPIAIPVSHVAFATGFKPIYSLSGRKAGLSSSFREENRAEDVIISLHKDNSIVIWSLLDCRCIHKVKGPPFAIKILCVLPDNRFVALVGRNKLNVIDLWRLKLIGMLEINGTCHFDKNIYSNNPTSLPTASFSGEFTLDHSNTDTFNVMPASPRTRGLYKKPRRILKATCGIVPPDDRLGHTDGNLDAWPFTKDIGKEQKTSCTSFPLLVALLLDNHEMVMWDLTDPILAYKRKYDPCNGPITVLTQWDYHQKRHIVYHKKGMHDFRDDYIRDLKPSSTLTMLMGGGDGSLGTFHEQRTELPMMGAWIPELEPTGGDVCIADHYVFVIFGVRILAWLYDGKGLLARVAELLSVDEAGIPQEDPWHGFQCIRDGSNRIFLVAWSLGGSVSVFKVPDIRDDVKHFSLISVVKYPPFDPNIRFKRSVIAYLPFVSELGKQKLHGTLGMLPELYLIKHCKNGGLYIATVDSKHWLSLFPGALLPRRALTAPSGVLGTCMVYQEGALHCVNLMRDGKIRICNLSNSAKVEISSCSELSRSLTHLTSGYRRKPLVLKGSTLLQWMKKLPQTEPYKELSLTEGGIIHCVGASYLVACVGSSHVFVYSMSSLQLGSVIANMHRYPVKAIYSVMSLYFSGPKASDAVFADLEDMFVTLDTAGCIVLIQLSLLSEALDSDDAVNPHIGKEEIYSDGAVSDEEDANAQWSELLEHYSSASPYRRGIYIMKSCKLLQGREIERVTVNMSKDLLFVLTCDLVLIWNLRNGNLLRSLRYLDTYRQAVSLSSGFAKGERSMVRHMSTLASTISSLLMTDWQNASPAADEDIYKRYIESILPGDLLCLSMFQEKCFKKRISPSLQISFLRMKFTHTSSTHEHQEPYLSKHRKLHLGSRTKKQNARWSHPFILRHCTQERNQYNHRRVKSITKRKAHKRRIDITTSELSHALPVLIFPMQEVISNFGGTGGSLLPKICDSGIACFLGIPPGTISIPLSFPGEHGDVDFNINSHDKGKNKKAFMDRCIDCPLRWNASTPSDLKASIANAIRFNMMENGDLPLNNYFSTCMLLRQLVLQYHSSSRDNYPWERSADLWVLCYILLVCSTAEALSHLYKGFLSVVKSLSREELALHVSRALALLRCRDIPPGDQAMAFPEVLVCYCNGIVFSFGKRCGLCLNGLPDACFIYTAPHSYTPIPWEEDTSLLLLSTIAMDERLSTYFGYVMLGSRCYSFVPYVAKLMLRQILCFDDDVRVSPDYPPRRRAFDQSSFYLDLLVRGFGKVWTLRSIDVYRILPRFFYRSKINMLARSFYESPQGSKLPSAQFIINSISLYRSSKCDNWFQLLTICFSHDPVLVMQIMRWIVQERRLHKWYIETAIELILQFATQFHELAVEHLPEIVVIIVRCLDPADPSLRLLMLKPATSALFYLVKSFPMVSFYQNTQRFAVGSTSGHVVIYDLRTATKCRVLGGDIKRVSSVAFSATGEYIAAYYKDDPCLIVWTCSSSGFLGSLLLSSKREQKIVKLKPVQPNAPYKPMEIKIQSKSNREWFLHREDGRGYMISI